MIDLNKVAFEDSVYDEDLKETVYYFTYPKDFGEIEFYPEKDYGNVVFMCISLTVPMHENDPDYRNAYLQMSPTVSTEDEDGLSDVDWRDLEKGINYTEDTVHDLIKIAKDSINAFG